MSSPCATDLKSELRSHSESLMGIFEISSRGGLGGALYDTCGELDGAIGVISGLDALLTATCDEEGKGSYI